MPHDAAQSLVRVERRRRLGHLSWRPRCGELRLESQDNDGRLIEQVAADPTGVDMDCVASMVRAIEDVAVPQTLLVAVDEVIE
jgi:hypothetical protein